MRSKMRSKPMLVRQNGSRFGFLITTSSIEQHGSKVAGHPPAPALPGPIWAPDGERFRKRRKIFKRTRFNRPPARLIRCQIAFFAFRRGCRRIERYAEVRRAGGM